MNVADIVVAGMAWSKIVSLYSTRRGLEIDLGREKMRWMPPPAEFYKLNTDGAVQEGTNEAAVGGLIRDYKGDWSIGFCRNIGACSVLGKTIWFRGKDTFGIANRKWELDEISGLFGTENFQYMSHKHKLQVVASEFLLFC